MIRKKSVSIFTKSVISFLLIVCFSIPLYGETYQSSDLSGTWYVASSWIDKDIGYLGWTTGSGSFGGTFSFFETESDGSTNSFTDTVGATIASSGVVTVTLGSGGSFQGYMNASKDVIVSSNNFDGDFNFITLVKKLVSGGSMPWIPLLLLGE